MVEKKCSSEEMFGRKIGFAFHQINKCSCVGCGCRMRKQEKSKYLLNKDNSSKYQMTDRLTQRVHLLSRSVELIILARSSSSRIHVEQRGSGSGPRDEKRNRMD